MWWCENVVLLLFGVSFFLKLPAKAMFMPPHSTTVFRMNLLHIAILRMSDSRIFFTFPTEEQQHMFCHCRHMPVELLPDSRVSRTRGLVRVYKVGAGHLLIQIEVLGGRFLSPNDCHCNYLRRYILYKTKMKKGKME